MSDKVRDDRYAQVFPASVRVDAVFTDGERYPVVAWAVCNETIAAEHPGERDILYATVVGLIIIAGSATLDLASEVSGFEGYEYKE